MPVSLWEVRSANVEGLRARHVPRSPLSRPEAPCLQGSIVQVARCHLYQIDRFRSFTVI